MVRKFERKKKNTITRERKPVMVVAGEGKNITELSYVRSFNTQHGKYVIRTQNAGHDTDPSGILKSIEKYWQDKELSEDLGDKAYILLDIDCSEARMKQIEDASNNSDYAEFILSNPCFEFWFLLHFECSDHSFSTNDELIRKLKKYIPNYEKSSDVSRILVPLTEKALANSEKIKNLHKRNNVPWPSAECNPMTDMGKVISEIQSHQA